MAVIFAVTANVLIFLSINWINRAPAVVPSENHAVFELLKPNLMLQETTHQINPIPVVPETNIHQVPEPMQMAMLNEFMFKPRLAEWVPDTLLDAPSVTIDFILPETVSSNLVEDVSVDQPNLVSGTSDFANKNTVSSSLSPYQVDNPPRRISGGSPVYPRWARSTKAESIVALRFIVGVDGRVSNIEVQKIDGDKRFAIAARKAIGKWRFKPAIDNGRPVAVWGIQKIQFQFKGQR